MIVARHEAYYGKRRAMQQVNAKAKAGIRSQNFAPVFAIGDIEFYHFRGRRYGVAALPYKVGLELLELWTEARDLGEKMTHAEARRYGQIIARMVRLMWPRMRLIGPGRRMLRRLGLWRSPFTEATEAEIVDLAHRFLTRRHHTTTGPQITGTADRLPRQTA